MDPLVADWFLKNCRLKKEEFQVETHRFSTTKVTELSTGYQYHAPLVAFTWAKARMMKFSDSGTALAPLCISRRKRRFREAGMNFVKDNP